MNHDGQNCREDYYDSWIGKIIGDYRVISRDDNFNYKIRCLRCNTEGSVKLRTLQLSQGFSHGLKCFKYLPDDGFKKVVYERLNDMKQRCNNPNNDNYAHYGARGIKVDYDNPMDLYVDFIDELKEHSARHGINNSTFDRIDVDGDYTKQNLRIATQNMQSTNTTRKRLFILEKDGERVISDSAMEFGRKYGVNGRSIGNVIRGQSHTAGGWRLVRIIEPNEIISDIIVAEDVTTNLITT